MNGHRVSLEGEQAIKERAITPEALTEILGGYVVALGPLFFELCAFVGELLGDSLYYVRDEAVGLLDGLTGLVDEGGLDLIPTCAEVMQLVVGEQWRGRIFCSFLRCDDRLRGFIMVVDYGWLDIRGSFGMCDVGGCKFFVG